MFVTYRFIKKRALLMVPYRVISMMDAKKIMEIDPNLIIDEKALKQAYLKRAKELHPDAGKNG
jgi:hypothetical protein